MVSSRDASAPPQKKCMKKGLPHYFNATAPFWWASGAELGLRPDSGQIGLRPDRRGASLPAKPVMK